VKASDPLATSMLNSPVENLDFNVAGRTLKWTWPEKGAATVVPEMSSADTLPHWAIDLLDSWNVDDIATKIAEADVRIAYPDRVGEEDFRDLLLESIRENLGHIRRYLADPSILANITLDRPISVARRQAQIGASQNALQHSYRVGIQMALDDWTSRIRAHGTAPERSAELAPALMASVAHFLHYQDFALGRASAEFSLQEETLRRTGAQIRTQVVLDLLNGSVAGDSSELLATLGYDTTVCHLGIMVKNMAESRLHRLLGTLRRAGGASESLSIRVRANEIALWLARPRTWPEPNVDAVRGSLSSAGITASVSTPVGGLDGLRDTYRQLQRLEALRPNLSDSDDVLYYQDHRLEILLATDPAPASRFVHDELKKLADNTEASARLRETISAAFAFGRHVAAAEQLGLHEHTVRNRLHRAEQLLGHPLSERRAELLVALRLRDSLAEHIWRSAPSSLFDTA
jgi:PucR C-terminal helix-turn-helix domain/GGDEF-like domain